LVEQLVRDHITAELEGNGTDFLVERVCSQWYDTRDAAEAVIERLNERAVGESLEGKSLFLVAEVVEEDGAFRISAH
jgi:hypothetical protein